MILVILAGCGGIAPANPTENESNQGEPTVEFAGEPEAEPSDTDQATPTAEMISSSGPASALATPLPDLTPSATDDADATDAAHEPNETDVSATQPQPTPTTTVALEELLEQPIGTSRPQGALAGAAGALPSSQPAEVTEDSGEGTESQAHTVDEDGELAIPALEPVVAPVATPLPETGNVEIAPTPDGTQRTLQVPILMYHYLSVPPANADIYRKDLSVSPELFAQHLDAMRAEGFTTISLYLFMQALATGAPLPEKPVILTFDDGYRDNYVNAFPALRDRGMTATFFVVSDFMDAERPEYMTWDMAREMLAGGMSIESHGRNHASLQGRDDDFLIWQALGSMETIQFELGVRPRFVAYPAGQYDEDTMRIFESAGYWAGVTTRQGATHSIDAPFELTRVRMRGTTTPTELIRLLNLNW